MLQQCGQVRKKLKSTLDPYAQVKTVDSVVHPIVCFTNHTPIAGPEGHLSLSECTPLLLISEGMAQRGAEEKSFGETTHEKA